MTWVTWPLAVVNIFLACFLVSIKLKFSKKFSNIITNGCYVRKNNYYEKIDWLKIANFSMMNLKQRYYVQRIFNKKCIFQQNISWLALDRHLLWYSRLFYKNFRSIGLVFHEKTGRKVNLDAWSRDLQVIFY